MTNEQRISVIKNIIIDFQTEIIKKYDEMLSAQRGSETFGNAFDEINDFKEQVEPLKQFLKLQEK
jgi:hypothetical protein